MYGGLSPNHRLKPKPKYIASGGEMIIPRICSTDNLIFKNGSLLSYARDYLINSTTGQIVLMSAATAGDLFEVVDFGATFIQPMRADRIAVRVMGQKGAGQTLYACVFGAEAGGFQWRRNGVPIAGATSQTYTQTSSDVGSIISVVCTTINSTGRL